MNLMLNMDCS